MVETDISKADKSRQIVAWIETDGWKGYCMLYYADGEWKDQDTTADTHAGEIKAWDYLFEPPQKKNGLRELYDKHNSMLDGPECQGYWELMDKIIDKLEELDE